MLDTVTTNPNPLTIAVNPATSANVDMAAHALGAEARYTIGLSGTLTLTSPLRGSSKSSTMQRFLQRELPELLALIPADTRVLVHLTGATESSANKLLTTLTAKGYRLLGVAWNYEHRGRLGWIAFQSPARSE